MIDSDIKVNHLCKSFDGKAVLDDLSIVFPQGKVTCVMGDSGCGKTTLLNILLGFCKPDSGNVKGLPDRIGVVFQEDRLCEDFNAISNVRLAAGDVHSDQEIIHLFEELGLSIDVNQKVKAFSGGMKRRVAMARALLFDCDLLVFDEAFKGLDGDTKRMVIDCVKRHANGRTIISVTHDQWEADTFGEQIIRLEK